MTGESILHGPHQDAQNVTMVSLPVFIAGGSRTVGDWKLEWVVHPRPHCAQ